MAARYRILTRAAPLHAAPPKQSIRKPIYHISLPANVDHNTACKHTQMHACIRLLGSLPVTRMLNCVPDHPIVIVGRSPCVTPL